MSFGDISKSWTPSAVPAAASNDDVSQISGSLQAIQVDATAHQIVHYDLTVSDMICFDTSTLLSCQ